MHILSEIETLKVLYSGFSIARYGDGEFKIMLDKRSIGLLQEYTKSLADRLLEVIKNKLPNLLIGVPNLFYRKPWVNMFHNKLRLLVGEDRQFASSFITRPSLVGLANQKYFDMVEELWKKRGVVIINFNEKILDHYLFRQCKKDFIEIPRKDCFGIYSDILEETSKHYEKNKLFLVSAGPTGTILSYDLAKNGERCLDIGQIAFEYSLFAKQSNLEKWTSQNTYRKK